MRIAIFIINSPRPDEHRGRVNNRMNKKFLTLALALLVITVLATATVSYASTKGKGKSIPVKAKVLGEKKDDKKDMKGKNPYMATVPADLTQAQTDELKAGAADHQPANLTFHVNSGMFWYAPNEIKVKQGDTVTIVFSNANGMHDFNLPDYGQKTKVIKAGETDSFTFTADKKGTFEYFCSVGNGYHRMKGQIGVLLVQ